MLETLCRKISWKDRGKVFILHTRIIVVKNEVAVGMPVTRHPPHRFQACGTTALGYCLRSDAENVDSGKGAAPAQWESTKRRSLSRFVASRTLFSPIDAASSPCVPVTAV
ncbi:MAG: hypothetical protein ACNY01_12505 [Desulfobacteria bacterium]